MLKRLHACIRNHGNYVSVCCGTYVAPNELLITNSMSTSGRGTAQAAAALLRAA